MASALQTGGCAAVRATGVELLTGQDFRESGLAARPPASPTNRLTPETKAYLQVLYKSFLISDCSDGPPLAAQIIAPRLTKTINTITTNIQLNPGLMTTTRFLGPGLGAFPTLKILSS